MEEKLYFISEVSKMVGVEPHVLRYWEEELKLEIGRNSQGKRCYTREDVEQLCRIKYWKDKGMQLKAVKEIMDGETQEQSARKADGELGEEGREEQIKEQREDTEKIPCDLITVEEPSDSMKRFEQILDGIIGQALERNNEKLVREICDTILEELNDRMEEKMEELLQKELLREMVQEGEREAAASAQRVKESVWKRWKRWLERYIGI